MQPGDLRFQGLNSFFKLFIFLEGKVLRKELASEVVAFSFFRLEEVHCTFLEGLGTHFCYTLKRGFLIQQFLSDIKVKA